MDRARRRRRRLAPDQRLARAGRLNRRETVVPPPGVSLHSMVAPMSWARLRIPAIPLPRRTSVGVPPPIPTPSSRTVSSHPRSFRVKARATFRAPAWRAALWSRSEEHTSELQSRENLVCRLLLEKKKKYETFCTYTIRL